MTHFPKLRKRTVFTVLDASTKLPAGLLTGNLVDYGNFDECIDAETKHPLVPQHCMVSFDVTAGRTADTSSLNVPVIYRWSYCLPQTCSAELLQSVLSRLLENIRLQANVTVLPEDCQVRERRQLTTGDIVGM